MGNTLGPMKRQPGLAARAARARDGGSMRCPGLFLVASVLCCGRTSLTHGVLGTGGTLGVTSTGGVLVGTGGSTSATGGVSGSGGTRAAGGGELGTGGATSASGGSAASDLDACSGDDDCRQCNWGAAPTDASQCTGYYCCGGIILSRRRCEANQAAWAITCPNQSPQPGVCPCVVECPGQAIACVGGRCGLSCPPTADAATSYCGDGVVNGTEECDDGADNGIDGRCTSSCRAILP